MARFLVAALAASALAGEASAAEPRFGELPPDSISVSEMGDVAAEICGDHLFDPAVVNARLPAGHRLVLAAEAAGKDAAVRSLIEADANRRTLAIGSLCFLSFGRFEVDGRAVPIRRAMPAAFWWAATEGPLDRNMRGKLEWVQLRSWYPVGAPERASILRTDPMAEFVDLDVERVDSNRWRVRLALSGETVSAEITTSGPRIPRKGPPGAMSVALSGASSDHFSVFTYFGHHHQAAEGRWRATGSGPFREAFAVGGEAGVLQTVFQDGWSARAGLYRFSSPGGRLE